MLKRSMVLPLLGFGIVGCLTACNDHDDNFNNFGADPSGVYEGTLTDNVTNNPTNVTAIIDENGQGRMAGQNGTYYLLNGISTSGDNVFARFNGISNQLDFPNGSLLTSGSLQGFLGHNSLNLTYTAQNQDSGAIRLNFDAVYLNPSSLSTLAGSYSSVSSTPTYNFTIASSGALSGTDSNGCTYAGSFFLVDRQLNAYEERFTQTCGSTVITFNGQADFVAGSTPQINFLADDGNSHFIAITLQQ